MTTIRLEVSNELMRNYTQADVLKPDRKFRALQADDGASLLFSIGTAGEFFLTKETPGTTHGWRRNDLSSGLPQRDPSVGALCTDFSCALSVNTSGKEAAIHLAVVVNDSNGDHLYLSLSNSASDTGWSDAPVWTACPFNAAVPGQQLQIAGVQISEASDAEYIVVDIVLDPADPTPLLERYYIDVRDPSAPRWIEHRTPIDIGSARYSSCLGRSSDAFGVDGLYLSGSVDGTAQLVYSPLFNAFDPAVPPLTRRLQLPGQTNPDSIAACRNPDNTSDLYATAKGTLYYFAADNQHDGAEAVAIASSTLLSDVRALFASTAGGRVAVWGLNRSNEVVYVSADHAQASHPSSWTRPITILSGVDAISPYLDRAYSANSFFAHTGTGLVKAVKSPTTSIWSARKITLPPLDLRTAPTAISSYTSRIQVSGPDGMPRANVSVSLSANNVTSVYVNHLYYLVGPDPVQVATDDTGSITVVEAVETLSGTRFTVTLGDQSLTINPMDKPLNKLGQLNSVSKLRSAKITAGDGSTRSLVSASVSEQDLAAVALSNTQLHTAYKSVSRTGYVSHVVSGTPSSHNLTGFADAIMTDLGDLFNWLESGVEHVVDIVRDAATDVWHFVAHIAGEVYHGALDCVEKIAGAVKWVFNAIETAIVEVIHFLEFLFEWTDILATHRVMKNVLRQYGKAAVDGLNDQKAALVSAADELQKEIDRWAGIPDFGPAEGSATAGRTPYVHLSAPASLGLHHYQGNASNAAATYEAPSLGVEVFQDLLRMIEQEGETLAGAYTAIKVDIVDQFSSLTAAQIVRKLAAIVTGTLLQTAEHILVTAIDVFFQLTAGFADMLDATIEIPVLSWLYRELTGDDLSVLDLICLVGAIAAVVTHKAIFGRAPFPSEDPLTGRLISAGSFAEIQSAYSESPHSLMSTHVIAPAADPVLNETRMKIFGQVSGVFAFVGGAVLAVATAFSSIPESPKAAVDTLSVVEGKRVKAIAAGLIAGMANLAFLSPNIATALNLGTLQPSRWFQAMNVSLSSISAAKGIVAAVFAGWDERTLVGKAQKYVFSGCESLLNLVWLVPAVANIVENHDRYDTDYKSLVVESVGNFAANIAGVLALLIEIDKDAESKVALITAQGILTSVSGVFMLLAGSIEEKAQSENQSAEVMPCAIVIGAIPPIA
ncbi:hypothetical protein A9R05_41935 (plasmid) [Burkholderia sp. KK1]|uniref:Uncharacterized protein n=1 Tax=Burkholderia sp. M701 TaxID=326454 RepID=V5YNL2_9BURK|nr:hypothetical protein [Burkholderia sp. M701]AQH05586.1 hypothetical protein A9R05_41935 [Burkholderia sp. KK1]BAO18849.1 hypothetical protein [Burkholderia sp. M701]